MIKDPILLKFSKLVSAGSKYGGNGKWAGHAVECRTGGVGKALPGQLSCRSLDSAEPVAGTGLKITGEEVSYKVPFGGGQEPSLSVASLLEPTYEWLPGNEGYHAVLASTQDIDAGNPGFEVSWRKALKIYLCWTWAGQSAATPFSENSNWRFHPFGVSAALPGGKSVTIQPSRILKTLVMAATSPVTSDLQQGVVGYRHYHLNSPFSTYPPWKANLGVL